ncbi:hypothetical protein J6590_092396 [Homalodisca vitripennis]|nr:hypothetical protein J6590_092396 [Homalodisca vitripennis]
MYLVTSEKYRTLFGDIVCPTAKTCLPLVTLSYHQKTKWGHTTQDMVCVMSSKCLPNG